MKRRILRYTFFFFLLILQGACARAETLMRNPEVLSIADDISEDNDALFAEYVDAQFHKDRGSEELPSAGKAVDATGYLTDLEKKIYRLIRPYIAQAAAGERSSAVFSVSAEEVGLLGKRWTASELGVDTIFYLDSGRYQHEAGQILAREIGYNAALLAAVAMKENPYELYWFDRTQGVIAMEGWILDFEYNRDRDKVTAVKVTGGGVDLCFSVAKEFSAGDFQVNTAFGTTVRTALASAKAIVEKYKEKDDRAKITAYKDEICALTSYNEIAAHGLVPYGNPWQLLWVFDRDPSTRVVCEGYSKALQYLCDLSSFRGEVSCICAEGDLRVRGLSEPHMWNVVHLDDGSNYLVDLTNTDGSPAGQGGHLFLVPCISGTVDKGYTFEGSDNIPVFYQYDPAMVLLYSKEMLRIAGDESLPEVSLEDRSMQNRSPSTPITKLVDAGSGNLRVYWRSKGRDVDGYQICWSKDPYMLINLKTASYINVNNTTRSGLKLGETYYVKVRTYILKDGKRVYSGWSGRKSITLERTLDAPVLTAVTAKTGRISSKWTRSKAAEGYQLRFSQYPEFKNSKSASVKGQYTTSYTRTNLAGGRTWYVSVRAWRTGPEGVRYYSPWSSTATVSVP